MEEIKINLPSFKEFRKIMNSSPDFYQPKETSKNTYDEISKAIENNEKIFATGGYTLFGLVVAIRLENKQEFLIFKDFVESE